MSDTSHIFQSLAVNATIAGAKTAAAVFTGSGAMLAEAIHSWSDCANQLLLLIGVKQAAKPPDDRHPLGHGRAVYFWSFLVALLLFTGGGVFSVYEGVHKLEHPEPVENPLWAVGILFFSLCLEGWATLGNLKEIRKRKGSMTVVRYLQDTKDSDLIVVFGENSAAVLGLVFALGAVAVSWQTGDGRWDAAGSVLVGLVLIGVAVFLAVEVKSLLVGERADPSVEEAVRALAATRPNIHAVLRVITVQQGPGQVMVAAKLKLNEALTAAQVVDELNAYERELKQKVPEVAFSFMEPDAVD